MTRVLRDLRGLDFAEIFFDHFKENQDVAISFEQGKGARVTSLQDYSTPGVTLLEPIALEPMTTYELIVLGSALNDSGVQLWAYDNTNRQLLSDGLVRLDESDLVNIMFITNRTPKTVFANFGVLFESPAEIGSEFIIEAMAIVKRDGTVTNRWRSYEIDNIFVTDMYSNNKWHPTMTLANTR